MNVTESKMCKKGTGQPIVHASTCRIRKSTFRLFIIAWDIQGAILGQRRYTKFFSGRKIQNWQTSDSIMVTKSGGVFSDKGCSTQIYPVSGHSSGN